MVHIQRLALRHSTSKQPQRTASLQVSAVCFNNEFRGTELASHYLMLIATITIASPAFAGAAAPAPAATGESPKALTRAEFLTNLHARFNAIDTNQDRYLETNEIAAAQQRELQRARAGALRKLEGKFNQLDANHDGQLSKAEFITAPRLRAHQTVQQIVGAFDSSKDGKISAQEYETRALADFNKTANSHKQVTQTQFLANLHARFNAMDSNHDGYLEATEIVAAQQKDLQAGTAEQQHLEAEFNQIDSNHDGQISKSEFMAFAPPAHPTETVQQMIGALDPSKDGKISVQEYDAKPLANFDRLDANHDGIITPQEIEAARPAGKR
jgi:Ca2+-binding EF-hand superfamily protein